MDPNQWLPTVAVIWPRCCVEAILAYSERHPFPDRQVADDGNLGIWARAEGVTVLATMPSLVEHRDDTPSLMGKHHMSGANPSRIATCWMGEELSPLTLQW
jgi:hypothetical protein